MWRVLWGLLICAAASADAVIVTRAMKADTIAEVFVGNGAVRVDLEIGVADLGAFHNLLPGGLREKLSLRAERIEGRDFGVFADGRALAPHIVEMKGRPRVRRDEISGDVIGELEETVLFIALTAMDLLDERRL